MINDHQEDKIRDLLSIVVIYFQMSENKDEVNKVSLIESQRGHCKQAASELVQIMGVDSSYPNRIPKRETIQQLPVVEVNNYALKRLANLMMDKLGYKKEGRDKFIASCIDKI